MPVTRDDYGPPFDFDPQSRTDLAFFNFRRLLEDAFKKGRVDPLKKGPQSRADKAQVAPRCAFIHKLRTEHGIEDWPTILRLCGEQGHRPVKLKTLRNQYSRWLRTNHQCP
jgi:hypothetical protein